MELIQVVPRLPPPPEGVGSFALALAEALRRSGIESRFVAAARLGRREAGELCERLEEGGETAALVHYVNYGYQERGCPVWLLEGLTRWRSRGPRRLVTMFHEVYATGLPWQSSFWLSPAQRRLAAALARLSEGLTTNMQLYRRRLRRWVSREVCVLPVVSTVGEPAAVPPLAARSRRLVLFGGPGTRARAWRELAPELAATCRALGIEEVCDIGPEVDFDTDLPVRRLGVLPESGISALLLDSVAGFVAYPAPFLAKSSIFAAYCAHGVLPVCAWPRPRREVETPPPFWKPGSPAAPDALQEIADRAHAWYSDHTLERHAATYRGLFGA
jgi:hypothetical protein